MSESAVFRAVAEALEAGTGWSRIEARGTVRIALKAGGLAPDSVTRSEMTAVLDRLMRDELEARGVGDVDALLGALSKALAETADGNATGSADAGDSFRRLWDR